MFPVIKNCANVLEKYLDENMKNGKDIHEFRDLLARFSTNIISSVAFGIDNDCINDPDHIFRQMGAKCFEPSFKNGIRGILSFFLPRLITLFKIKSTDDDVEDFIFSMVKQSVELREKNEFTRNDFMQLLVQLKNQGYVSADKDSIENDGKKPEGVVTKMTMNELAAQVFVFFLAGKLSIGNVPQS